VLLQNKISNKDIIIIPSENYKTDARSTWESYFNENQLDIAVVAISDRKLMPFFIMKENLTTQLN